MARTRGTIPTPANIEPEVGLPLDARQRVATKADLTASGSFPYPWIGMEVYCAQDGKTYQLVNDDPTIESSWKILPGSEVIEQVDTAYQLAINHDSFLSYVLQLGDRVSQLEKAMSENDVFIRTCTITNETIKENILPNHLKSKFCRKLTLEYNGTWSGDSYESVKINNKSITFENDITLTSGTHIVKFEVYETTQANRVLLIKKIFNEGTQDEQSIETQLEDTFVLTIEVATGSDSAIASLNYQLVKMEYADVDLDYPYPVLELRDGTVVYRPSTSGVDTDVPNNFGFIMDVYACYNLGNRTTGAQKPFITYTSNYQSQYKGCEYIYMANWYWLPNVVSGNNLDMFTNLGDDAAFRNIQPTITKLDFSKIRFNKSNFKIKSLLLYMCCDYFADDFVKVFFENENASYTGNMSIRLPYVKYLSTNMASLPLNRIEQIAFANCHSLKSLGDLSGWDITQVSAISAIFSGCYNLEYVGEVGKWDVSGKVKLTNIFKGCFNIRDIGDSIGDWDVSSATQLNWTFESCNYIGDETLHTLGKWNVGNCQIFRGLFSYLYEDSVFGPNGWATNFYKQNNMQYPPAIVNKRTDLSFVENWDMKSGDRLSAFFANNPYLTNVGDLRKWNLVAATITTQDKDNGYGLADFLLNCSALVNLKMPSIPRGTDVDGFVSGCTSLANIEVNELNVAAISFEDSPLTKQSVLNLINAATDDIDITLKADVYTAYASDSDVTAAIASKASSSITVQLISA